MEKLQIYMDILEYSQVELARDIGVHHSNVGYWLSGKTKPKGHNLDKLCACLGVEPEMIMT